MIDHIRGVVHRVAASHVVLDVGGIGVRVEATPAMAAALRTGEAQQVPTSLVIREDAWTLYGFQDADERDVFELVQTVSGIGPRTAQALIATLTSDGLRRAVAAEDVATVMRVPGIGRKGAQRIILELADRLGPPARAEDTIVLPPAPESDGWRESVVTGLVSLGYTQREAQAAARSVEPIAADDGRPDVAALLRAALREVRRTP